MFNTALCYHFGMGGVDARYSTAASLYRKAGAKGSGKALYNLGMCAFYGQGVDRDPEKAIANLRAAAKLGDGNALNNLGYCYLYDKGVSKNDRTAVTYFHKAALMRHRLGLRNLALCFSRGLGGVLKDESVAAQLNSVTAVDRMSDEELQRLADISQSRKGSRFPRTDSQRLSDTSRKDLNTRTFRIAAVHREFEKTGDVPSLACGCDALRRRKSDRDDGTKPELRGLDQSGDSSGSEGEAEDGDSHTTDLPAGGHALLTAGDMASHGSFDDMQGSREAWARDARDSLSAGGGVPDQQEATGIAYVPGTGQPTRNLPSLVREANYFGDGAKPRFYEQTSTLARLRFKYTASEARLLRERKVLASPIRHKLRRDPRRHLEALSRRLDNTWTGLGSQGGRRPLADRLQLDAVPAAPSISGLSAMSSVDTFVTSAEHVDAQLVGHAAGIRHF